MGNDRADAGLEPGADGADFFGGAKKKLAARAPDRDLVLCIPLWGWTGNGKTCALLSAQYFCDPVEHAVGLALATDRGELERLEQAREEYRGLNLPELAAGTVERFSAIQERFIDGTEWPPGTNEGFAYLFRIRGLDRSHGFVVFPDIRGGSYRESDETARSVLTGAHACGVLIEPDAFTKPGSEGKRYRDEVAQRISACAEAKIPVAAMITKADLYPGPKSAADDAHRQVTVLINEHKELRAECFRVSVIGKPAAEGGLPSLAERAPNELIRAFVWLLTTALERSPEDIRKIVPPVRLRAAGRGPAAASLVAEVRRVGEFSSKLGRVICASPGNGRSALFLDEAGSLTQVSVTRGSASPTTSPAGTLPDFKETGDLQADVLGGVLVVGLRRGANAVWIGNLGDRLECLTLPFKLRTWTAVGVRRLAGIDESGRLSLLSLSGDKAAQMDFHADLNPGTTGVACGFASTPASVVIATQRSIEAVRLETSEKLGERVKLTVSLPFDTDRVIVGPGSLVAAVNSQSALIASIGKPAPIGSAHPGIPFPFALSRRRAIAAIDPAQKILVATIAEDGSARIAAVEHCPTLPAIPNALPKAISWGADDLSVFVTLGDGTWAVYAMSGFAGA